MKHIRQTFITAVVNVRKPFVFQTEQVQDRCVQVRGLSPLSALQGAWHLTRGIPLASFLSRDCAGIAGRACWTAQNKMLAQSDAKKKIINAHVQSGRSRCDMQRRSGRW